VAIITCGKYCDLKFVVVQKVRKTSIQTFNDLGKYTLRDDKFQEKPILLDTCVTFHESSAVSIYFNGNRSTRRNHAPVPICSTQIPHDLTLPRIRTAAVEYIHLEKLYQVKVPVKLSAVLN
jgi:hypothetical protein